MPQIIIRTTVQTPDGSQNVKDEVFAEPEQFPVALEPGRIETINGRRLRYLMSRDNRLIFEPVEDA